LKKPNREKKQIKILKKPTVSVQFRFYKPNTEKTEPDRTQSEKNRAKPEKKPSQIEPNRFKLIFILKTKLKPVGLNRL